MNIKSENEVNKFIKHGNDLFINIFVMLFYVMRVTDVFRTSTINSVRDL